MRVQTACVALRTFHVLEETIQPGTRITTSSIISSRVELVSEVAMSCLWTIMNYTYTDRPNISIAPSLTTHSRLQWSKCATGTEFLGPRKSPLCVPGPGPGPYSRKIANSFRTCDNRKPNLRRWKLFTRQIAGATIAKVDADDSKICYIPIVVAET